MSRPPLLPLLAAVFLVSCSTPAEKAARELARRVAPSYRIQFRQTRDTAECYTLRSKGRTLLIEGSTPSALTAGLGRYLRESCGADISWYADDPILLPSPQPVLPEPIRGKALVGKRFFLNYCTFGYTLPWWKWQQWERLIDWMALQGVNLPLAITGQESSWQEVWRQHGLSDDRIRAWFTGPAHLPWHRMCNIDGVDGPLPQGWIDGQEALQKQILQRERELGMTPVLPAFAGHVPAELKQLYPDAHITDIKAWGGFPPENLPHFLSPEDSLYALIQWQFLEAQTRRYGTGHVYGFDLFNEVDPPSWDPETLTRIGQKAFESVSGVDPEARWLQMGWLFYYDRKHWTPEVVKAYLEAIPKGKVTLLDYYTENTPVWKFTEGFYGQPYIFCYLGNFGGNTRLAGPFRKESERITEALEAGADGLGCTLEGFGVNRWLYEYVLDRAWGSVLPDDAWLESLGRRHHAPEGLWKELADSVYIRGSFSEGPLLCGRPCREGWQHWTVIHNTPYDNAILVRAWRKFLDHPADTPAWRADAVLLGTQALGNHFALLRDAFTNACTSRNYDEAAWLSGQMQQLLQDIATLSAADPHNSFRSWLKAAESWALDPAEKEYYRHNAWHILTTWGTAPNLNDYASRVWSGLVTRYYAPRWNLFLESMLQSVAQGVPFSDEDFFRQCDTLEKNIVREAPQVTEPVPADLPALCQDLLSRWF